MSIGPTSNNRIEHPFIGNPQVVSLQNDLADLQLSNDAPVSASAGRLEQLRAAELEQIGRREYERQVDEFLTKLVECGYRGNPSGLRHPILTDRRLILHLESQNLTSIPAEIGNLKYLEVLNLSCNKLTTLPPEIGKLQKLTRLELSFNQLTALPPEIGRLQKLTRLDLLGNRLTSVPREIGNLQNMTWLKLSNNQLTTLPAETANLQNLRELYLSHNQFTIFPSEICSLQNLTHLDLSANRLTSIPAEIGRLQNLIRLSLSTNQLATFPTAICSLQKLKGLDLSSNQFITLPAEIANLKNLEKFNLKQNQFSTFPSEILSVQNLTELNVSNNQLTTLPSEIGSLQKLEFLSLSGNQLTSVLPEIANLHNLTYLNLSDNQLTSVPPEIGRLQNLVELHVISNQLTILPAEIGNLRRLTLLHLSRTPLAANGEGQENWGRRELRHWFGDRVCMDDPNKAAAMPANTTEHRVYTALDVKLPRIQREIFIAAQMAEIPIAAIEDGSLFLSEFARLYTHLNFNKMMEPGYLSYEMLSGDFQAEGAQDTKSNIQKIDFYLMPRLMGYFKTLYDLPLSDGELSGWQMYDEQKPAMKKALTYILHRLNSDMDPDQRAILFQHFVDGMLHCPTGQKEGIDTVILALLEGKIEKSTDLAQQVRDILGIKKNRAFKTAILTKAAENTQNVHLISYYEHLLATELGLSNILGYTERMGTIGRDPFSNNKANVLQIYYSQVTPNRLVDWLMERTPSVQDHELRTNLAQLEKRRDSALLPKMLDAVRANAKIMATYENRVSVPLSSEELNELKKEIGQIKAKIRITVQFKPIETHMVMQYLMKNKILEIHDGQVQDENWWRPYFTNDPVLDETAALTRNGAMQLLAHLGYICL